MARMLGGAVLLLLLVVAEGGHGGDLSFELDQEFDLPAGLLPETDNFTVRLADIDLDGSLDLIAEDSSFIGVHNLADNRLIIGFPKLCDSLPRAVKLGHLDADTAVDYLMLCAEPRSGSYRLHAVRFLSSRNYLQPDTLVLRDLTDRDWSIDSLFLQDIDNDDLVEVYGALAYSGAETGDTVYFGYELDGPTDMGDTLPLDTSSLGRRYQLHPGGVRRYVQVAHQGSTCTAPPDEFCADTGAAMLRIYDDQGIEAEQMFESPLDCGGGEELLRGRYATIEQYAVGDVWGSGGGTQVILHVKYQSWVYAEDSSLVCGTTSDRLHMWDVTIPGSIDPTRTDRFPYDDARDAMYVDSRFRNRVLLAGRLDVPGEAFFYLYDLYYRMAVDTIQAGILEGDILDYRPLREGDNPAFITVDNLGTVRLYSILSPTAVAEPDGNPLIPSGFSLGHPYPNPFNSSVTIPLTVQRKGRLLAEVVNVLGRRVTTLYDEAVEPGPMTLEWNSGNAASGVYFLRVSDQRHSATAKMILMK